jgi:hypothetical protein
MGLFRVTNGCSFQVLSLSENSDLGLLRFDVLYKKSKTRNTTAVFYFLPQMECLVCKIEFLKGDQKIKCILCENSFTDAVFHVNSQYFTLFFFVVYLLLNYLKCKRP